MTLSEVRNLPKVELHRHIEGAVRPETIIEIGTKLGLKLPATTPDGLRKALYIRRPGLPFKEILGRFDLAQSCFAGKENIRRITFEVMEDAAKDNIVLIELRYSPSYMSKGHNLAWHEILDSILIGMEDASRQFGLAAGLIVISSRDFGVDACRKTIDFAVERRDSIVGVDLAGDEEGWPCEMFAGEFKKARDAGLRVTVHAGELAGSRDVWDAVKELGAERIGHGLGAAEDPALMDFLARQNITLELCPTSNIVTGAVRAPGEYPLRKFIERGVRVTLNADDPEIFGITLSDEYQFAVENAAFDAGDLADTAAAGVRASFLGDEEKAAAGKRLTNGLEGHADKR